MSVGAPFLGVAVGTFARTTRPVEALPSLGAALDGSNEARMVCERHAVALAQDAEALRAVLLLLGGALQAAARRPALRFDKRSPCRDTAGRRGQRACRVGHSPG